MRISWEIDFARDFLRILCKIPHIRQSNPGSLPSHRKLMFLECIRLFLDIWSDSHNLVHHCDLHNRLLNCKLCHTLCIFCYCKKSICWNICLSFWPLWSVDSLQSNSKPVSLQECWYSLLVELVSADNLLFDIYLNNLDKHTSPRMCGYNSALSTERLRLQLKSLRCPCLALQKFVMGR